MTTNRTTGGGTTGARTQQAKYTTEGRERGYERVGYERMVERDLVAKGGLSEGVL